MSNARLDVGVLLILLGVLLCLGAAILWRRPPERTATATPSLTLTHAGAVPGWSPAADVAQAEQARDRIADLAQAERDELADAAAELKPLLDAEHSALGIAWRAFDAAMVAPMRTAALWHQADRACCKRCAITLEHEIGPIGPERRIGLRGWREDTPTGEYLMITVDRPMMAAALLES